MHASGFGGNNTRDWRSIQNPISRSVARKWEESQAIGRAYQSQFNGMLGPVGGPDIRSRVFGSIPTANAISERIQEQTFHMQQEHAWNQFERELEEAFTESYEGDSTSSSSATISTTALEEKALAKQISNTAKALENAVIRKARSKSTGDKSALIDGLWDVESYRAKQELEATISNMSLSAKVRMGAEIALELATEGMMTLHGEMKARPVHTAGRAVATGIEMGVPLGDAALKTSSGIVEACRGEFAASGSLFVAALTSAGLDLTAAGLMKKAVVGSTAITKAARGMGRAFQEKYVQKMLSRMEHAGAKLDGKLFQNHHIISNKHDLVKNHDLIRLAGFNLESSANKMFLPTRAGANVSTTVRSIHEGRHIEAVSADLAEKMTDYVVMGRQFGWNQAQYHAALMDVITGERAALKSGDRLLNMHHRPWATGDRK